MTEGSIAKSEKRPMRARIYEIRDEAGKLDKMIFKYVTNLEHRHAMRDELKKVLALVNAL